MDANYVIKRIFSLVLIGSFIFQAGGQAYMNIWYWLANASFEEQFCENKSNPEKKCHGSCMIKKINKAPDENKDLSPTFFIVQMELTHFLFDNLFPTIIKSRTFSINNFPTYFFAIQKEKFLRVFHPPE